jgi:hypothetical protein
MTERGARDHGDPERAKTLLDDFIGRRSVGSGLAPLEPSHHEGGHVIEIPSEKKRREHSIDAVRRFGDVFEGENGPLRDPKMPARGHRAQKRQIASDDDPSNAPRRRRAETS